MALKAVVENLDDVEEAFRGEYKESVDPKTKAKVYALDIENADAHPRVRTLKDEAAQHRIKARDAEGKLAPYLALGDPTEVQAKLDRYPELEAAAEGKLDDGKLNAIVETRLKTKLAPIERERDQYKTRATELEGKVGELTAAETRRRVTSSLSKAARELKVVDTAMEDVELYGDRVFEVQDDGSVVTRDNVGVTPGLTPKQWLEDMQAKRPHWWGPTAGGGASGNRSGANGGGGANPWLAENWNITEQGRVLTSKGRAEAERLAKAAGTTLGGRKPEPRK